MNALLNIIRLVFIPSTLAAAGCVATAAGAPGSTDKSAGMASEQDPFVLADCWVVQGDQAGSFRQDQVACALDEHNVDLGGVTVSAVMGMTPSNRVLFEENGDEFRVELAAVNAYPLTITLQGEANATTLLRPFDITGIIEAPDAVVSLSFDAELWVIDIEDRGMRASFEIELAIPLTRYVGEVEINGTDVATAMVFAGSGPTSLGILVPPGTESIEATYTTRDYDTSSGLPEERAGRILFTGSTSLLATDEGLIR